MTLSNSALLTHRHQPRVKSPKLEAAVVRKKFAWLTDHEYCYLLDINSGGIGIASETLDIKVGKTFDLELYHDMETYPIRCVVIHKSFKDEAHHYGLAFVEAPAALDHLIAVFLKEHAEQKASRTEADAQSQRAGGNRLVTADAHIYVRRLDSADAYILCRVENISRGGLGFSCLHKFGDAAPFDIAVRISEQADAAPLAGRVVHMQKHLDRYHYGMEYRQVPEELARLIELLEASPA